jgi:hypothetical protein
MSSLIREAMLPAAASVGFLVAMAIPSAQAQEVATAPEPVAVLASASSAASLGGDEPDADARVAPETMKPGPTKRGGRRCERVERIGKFVIRRCE